MKGLGLSQKVKNFIGFLFFFMIMIVFRPRREFCQNDVELIKAKNGEKNYPARKSRTKEESASFIKEMAPRRTPKRLSKKRTSRPTLDWLCLSGEKDFLISSLPQTRPSQPLR
jgi:hypothetical protein